MINSVNHKNTRSITFLIGALLLIVVLILFANSRYQNSSQWVTHTWSVKNDIRKLESSLKDAERGQRGFLLTKDENYLAPYLASIDQYKFIHLELRELIGDNPTQLKALSEIDSISKLKFQELQETINLVRSNAIQDALALVETGKGKSFMESIESRLDTMVAVENSLLLEREKYNQFWIKIIFGLLIVSIIIVVVSLFNLYRKLRPLIHELSTSEENLKLINTNLESTLDQLRDSEAVKENLLQKNNRLIDSLKVKNEQLDHFAYVASHDLQEPLRTVTNYIEIYKEDYGSKLDDNAHQYFNFIEEATVRMKRLISGLLTYSRLGTSGKKEVIDCNNIVETIKNDFAAVIKDKTITLNIEKLPKVTGYKIELKQLFQNLISNAIKFSKPDVPPVIHIAVISRKEDYEFQIKDNGIGIKEKDLQKIFDMFSRLHSSKTYEGQGIGLAFCKKIVELHSGRIWATSIPNEETIFHFTIPK